MSNTANELVKQLDQFRLESGKRSENRVTHAGMNGTIPGTRGAFGVPDERLEEFIETIGGFMWRDNLTIGLAEQHFSTKHDEHTNTPIIVDIDMRQELSDDVEKAHRFTEANIDDFVAMYCDKVMDVFNSETLPATFDIYVFARGCLTNVKENVWKDGLHMFIPEIVTDVPQQQVLRREVLRDICEVFPLSMYGCMPGFAANDLQDAGPIEKSGMLMYGSRKSTEPPQNFQAHQRQNVETNGLESMEIGEDLTVEDNIELMKLVSIRYNVSAEVSVLLNEEFNATQELLLAARNPSVATGLAALASPVVADTGSVDGLSSGGTDPFDVTVELVTKLVDCLSVERSDNQETWVRVGWCLKNISREYPHIDVEKMQDLWIEFSAKSDKQTENVENHEQWRTKFWNNPRDNGGLLRFGSLKYWAKNDSPLKQAEIHALCVADAVKHVIFKKGTQTPMADLVKELQSQEFKCASIANKIWYQQIQSEHRWVHMDSATSLRRLVSTEVNALFERELRVAKDAELKQFQERQETANNATTGGDVASVKIDRARSKPIADIVKDLETTGYLDSIIKECSHKFQDPAFYEMLDSNEYLFAFKNGVLDLTPGEDIMFRQLRPGKPEDMISFQSPIELIEYDEDNEIIREAQKFVAEIFYGDINQPVKEQVLKILASCLRGGNFQQEFQFLNGCGANGKSVLMDVVQQIFGKGESGYGATLNVALMTQKRGDANSASPELAKLKGKRFVKMEEPDESKSTRINTGILKEWTGGSDITCRALQMGPIEFKAMFKMFFSCNDFPDINGEDPAVWRRVRVIEFMTKFTNDKRELRRRNDIVNQRPRDAKYMRTEFQKQLAVGLAAWLWYIQRQTFVDESVKITPPEKVMEFTRMKQMENNLIAQQLEECVSDWKEEVLEEAEEGAAAAAAGSVPANVPEASYSSGEDDEDDDDDEDIVEKIVLRDGVRIRQTRCTREDSLSVVELWNGFRKWQENEYGGKTPLSKREFTDKIWNELRSRIIKSNPGQQIRQRDKNRQNRQPFTCWRKNPMALDAAADGVLDLGITGAFGSAFGKRGI